MTETAAFVVVDVQKDFCPGGLRSVAEGDAVIDPINRMLAHARKNDWLVAASRDWHTRNQFVDERKVHCIRGTDGAEFHPDLNLPLEVAIISKGEQDRHHSAFNGDNLSLENLLHERGIREVYVGGLAYDICVKETALDSCSRGYVTYVLEDASRTAVPTPELLARLRSELQAAGAILTTVADVIHP